LDNAEHDPKDLLLHIARCDEAQALVSSPLRPSPCFKVVSSQGAKCWADFQVPEPWSGHIQTAPILFLSSNPSISQVEDYPAGTAGNSLLWDFFDNRFDGHWVQDGIRPRLQDGSYGKAVPYWSHMRNRAEELLGRVARPGVDYALAEIVHCKSSMASGVPEALTPCSVRYLSRLLACSGAKVVVLVGKKAMNHWNAQSGNKAVPVREGTGLQPVFGRERWVVYLPAPASFEKDKKFAARLSPGTLANLRELLLSRPETALRSRLISPASLT
jgi:hypothetical protein